MNDMNVTAKSNLSTFSHTELKQREEAFLKRMDQIYAFEESQPAYGFRDQITQTKIDLAHLIGPALADPFLKILDACSPEPQASQADLDVSIAQEKDAECERLNVAIDKMIRLMIKVDDNGLFIAEHVNQSNNLMGIDLINAVITALEKQLAAERAEMLEWLQCDPDSPPRYLIDDVRWSIETKVYKNRAEFYEAVHRCRLEICFRGSWDPDRVALIGTDIDVHAACAVHSDAVCPGNVHRLKSDNDKWFTQGELLYKLHNATVGKCSSSVGGHFEGIELSDQCKPSKPPVYRI